MEKVVYFLLLDRKRRQPALKDSIPLRKRWKNRASSRETPHKRVDSVKLETSEPAAAPVSPQISGCVVRVLCVCVILSMKNSLQDFIFICKSIINVGLWTLR